MENEIDYLKMKTPLEYQITEYDCGQACLLNAMRFLYTRGEISPIILKTIYNITLDTINSNNEIGKRGTTPYAMEYFSEWLKYNSKELNLGLKSEILKGKDVDVNNEKFKYCIKNGGVAILRVWEESHHYVLCTGLDEEYCYIFDPYYVPDNDYADDTECTVIPDRPYNYNRKVTKNRINSNTKNSFALVRDNNEIILLLYR